MSDKVGLSKNLYHLGGTFFERKDFNMAENYYRQAVIVGREINAKNQLLAAYIGLSDSLDAWGELEEACHIRTAGYDMAVEMGRAIFIDYLDKKIAEDC